MRVYERIKHGSFIKMSTETRRRLHLYPGSSEYHFTPCGEEAGERSERGRAAGTSLPSACASSATRDSGFPQQPRAPGIRPNASQVSSWLKSQRDADKRAGSSLPTFPEDPPPSQVPSPAPVTGGTPGSYLVSAARRLHGRPPCASGTRSPRAPLPADGRPGRDAPRARAPTSAAPARGERASGSGAPPAATGSPPAPTQARCPRRFPTHAEPRPHLRCAPSSLPRRESSGTPSSRGPRCLRGRRRWERTCAEEDPEAPFPECCAVGRPDSTTFPIVLCTCFLTYS